MKRPLVITPTLELGTPRRAMNTIGLRISRGPLRQSVCFATQAARVLFQEH